MICSLKKFSKSESYCMCSQRTLIMFVEVVVHRYQHHYEVPQLPQTKSESFDQCMLFSSISGDTAAEDALLMVEALQKVGMDNSAGKLQLQQLVNIGVFIDSYGIS